MESRKSIRIKKKKEKIKKIMPIVCIVMVIVLLIAVYFIIKNINHGKSLQSEANTPAPTVEASLMPTANPTIEPTAEPTPEPTPEPIQRRGTAAPIPDSVRMTMKGYSMPDNATISYDDLSYLTIPHYDYNYNIVEGHMIVNKELAEEVLNIFADLFDIKYPIERMELIDKYGADDYVSIDNNNTSAFNYRESTDGSGRLSKHALGRAIDINPQINPYVNSNGTGAHQNAREYWSRDAASWTSDIAKASYIGVDTDIYRIFVDKYGWEWGGSWSTYRDYQHFQKNK